MAEETPLLQFQSFLYLGFAIPLRDLVFESMMSVSLMSVPTAAAYNGCTDFQEKKKRNSL